MATALSSKEILDAVVSILKSVLDFNGLNPHQLKVLQPGGIEEVPLAGEITPLVPAIFARAGDATIDLDTVGGTYRVLHPIRVLYIRDFQPAANYQRDFWQKVDDVGEAFLDNQALKGEPMPSGVTVLFARTATVEYVAPEQAALHDRGRADVLVAAVTVQVEIETL